MNESTGVIHGELPARERILRTAHDLFYAEGLRATGIDRVIAEAGVTKVTFYRHFPSKNDLILAYLNLRHEQWMAWFVAALARHGAASKGAQALVPAMLHGDKSLPQAAAASRDGPTPWALAALLLTVCALAVRWLIHLGGA